MRKEWKLLSASVLAFSILPLSVSAQDAVEVEIGDVVDATLERGVASVEFTLHLDRDQGVVITHVSEDFDSYLIILDSDGEEVASDDDSAGSLDAEVIFIPLVTDDYTIVATSYQNRWGDANSEGDFTLSVGEYEIRPIEYTQVVESELTSANTTENFSFSGQAGDIVIITQSSTDFDAYLSLQDSSGYQLTTNDDGGGNRNSRIFYTLPYTDRYTIVAGSFSGSSEGEYTLTLNRASSNEINIGDVATAEVEYNSPAYFQLPATRTDFINIVVTADVPTRVELLDPYNYILASDEGDEPTIVNYRITSDGTYLIAVSLLEDPRATVDAEATPEAEDVDTSVTVELNVSAGELDNLDNGPITLEFGSSSESQSIAFTGEEGVPVTIHFDVVDGDTMSPSIDFTDEFSNPVSYLSVSYATAASVEVVPEMDGTIIVTISEYSYSSLSIEVSVETSAE